MTPAYEEIKIEYSFSLATCVNQVDDKKCWSEMKCHFFQDIFYLEISFSNLILRKFEVRNINLKMKIVLVFLIGLGLGSN